MDRKRLVDQITRRVVGSRVSYGSVKYETGGGFGKVRLANAKTREAIRRLSSGVGRIPQSYLRKALRYLDKVTYEVQEAYIAFEEETGEGDPGAYM